MKTVEIDAHKDQTTALALDTIRQGKQALIFCSSKKAAESQAEKIAIALSEVTGEDMATAALKALQSPTKQCQRLALCLKKSVAFHHAGLATKQRELIEDNFRANKVHVICSTPTLAAGLDMPAYRAIIRDTKRFGQRGMQPIPVLEYEQMAGRAGRPGQEDKGEAIIVASKETDLNLLTEQYVYGEVEDIYSKLAVEPVLRTFVLSLISTDVTRTQEELNEFFDKTFYAFQFRNEKQIHATLARVIHQLQEWQFLESNAPKKLSGFMSAAALEPEKNQTLIATPLGKRVSEMYLDPLTAHMLLEGMVSITQQTKPSSIIHLLTCALELRPLIRARVADMPQLEHMKHEIDLLIDEEEFFAYQTDDFEDTLQTTRVILGWINEAGEEFLLERFNVRPGELHMKLQVYDWLIYSLEELARIESQFPVVKRLKKVRVQLKHGVKEELLPLLAFKNIGRVRARKLFTANLKGISDIRKANTALLVKLLGEKTAQDLKKQVGEVAEDEQTWLE